MIDFHELAQAFTTWEERYREEPEKFAADWSNMPAETYGEQAAAYMLTLLNEQAK